MDNTESREFLGSSTFIGLRSADSLARRRLGRRAVNREIVESPTAGEEEEEEKRRSESSRGRSRSGLVALSRTRLFITVWYGEFEFTGLFLDRKQNWYVFHRKKGVWDSKSPFVRWTNHLNFVLKLEDKLVVAVYINSGASEFGWKPSLCTIMVLSLWRWILVNKFKLYKMCQKFSYNFYPFLYARRRRRGSIHLRTT